MARHPNIAKTVNEARKLLLKTGSVGLLLFILLVTVVSIYLEKRVIVAEVEKEEEAVEKSLEGMTGFRTV